MGLGVVIKLNFVSDCQNQKFPTNRLALPIKYLINLNFMEKFAFLYFNIITDPLKCCSLIVLFFSSMPNQVPLFFPVLACVPLCYSECRGWKGWRSGALGPVFKSIKTAGGVLFALYITCQRWLCVNRIYTTRLFANQNKHGLVMPQPVSDHGYGAFCILWTSWVMVLFPEFKPAVCSANLYQRKWKSSLKQAYI